MDQARGQRHRRGLAIAALALTVLVALVVWALVGVAVGRLVDVGVAAVRVAVLAANGPAVGFYEHLGARQVDERATAEGSHQPPELVYEWSGEELRRLAERPG